MNSNDPMEILLNQVMEQLGVKEKYDSLNESSKKKNGCNTNLSTSQLLVIVALLAGVLEVESITIDKNQVVDIILSGSLKRPKAKTQFEQIMDQVGSLPFDQVMKNILGRY